MTIWNQGGTTMKFKHLHQILVRRLLEGEGTASHAQRRAAFDNTGLAEPLGELMDKVANCAYKVSDEDMDTVKKSGVSEDQIFELVICAAVGKASRQYDGALKVLDEVVGDKGGNGHAS
jgi:alkylhydroperoxidase/carboxymuconolactone decarboxylase family protein YurZ